jgi:hypothetical protein
MYLTYPAPGGRLPPFRHQDIDIGTQIIYVYRTAVFNHHQHASRAPVARWPLERIPAILALHIHQASLSSSFSSPRHPGVAR